MTSKNMENMLVENCWAPVADKIQAPEMGVSLKRSLFERVFENNIQYLLSHFSTDDLLYPFRVRGQKKDAPRTRSLVPFWEDDLEGSNAGRFLLGAGNTLRWVEHNQLRDMLDEVVNGIMECQEEDGYCMGFPKEHMLILERANYTRSWLTRGLLHAGRAGNGKAYRLVREFSDWFNRCPQLCKVGELHLSYQGMVANTSTYLSPIGEKEDIYTVLEHYQQDWWLDELQKKNEHVIWQYPNDGSHGYEINAFVAYLDLYAITGEKRYLNAMLAAYDLIQEKWEHIGGSMAICEEHDGIFPYAPASRFICADRHTGETCNNFWWLLFNQKLHMLFPEEEKYVSEMEKSIYNVLLPAQGDSAGIRYHAYLHGIKDHPNHDNTCCEGTGTQLFGMLPELIYSLSEDGVYINLFNASSISWKQKDASCRLDMETFFPYGTDIKLRVTGDKPQYYKMHIRIPDWTVNDVSICVDGKHAAFGHPGSYAVLDRVWESGAAISFALPMGFRCSRYFGFNTIKGQERFALEYGPFLMSFVGEMIAVSEDKVAYNDRKGKDIRSDYNNKMISIAHTSENIIESLLPVDGKPLHFTVKGDPAHICMPYFEVEDAMTYSCFPILKTTKAIIGDKKVTPRDAELFFKKGQTLALVIGDNLEIELNAIPSGDFWMGQDGFEKGEKPVHRVKLGRAFFIGKYQITQKQFESVMGYNPSYSKEENNPVEQVSFYDCATFIEKINESIDNSGLRLRLPTEAEWEYAARAGSSGTNAYYGDSLRGMESYAWNFQQLGAQSVNQNTIATSHEVGQKHQNMWGLYDMLGNVGEWCNDWYGAYCSDAAIQFDPYGPSCGNMKVVRGGCFTDVATYCRCASRNCMPPDTANKYTGFRVVAVFTENAIEE